MRSGEGVVIETEHKSVFDWRWVVAAYCSLVLVQLFPSYFLFGLRAVPASSMSGVYLVWLGVGVAVVAYLIGSRSDGYPVLESFLIALLYLVTVAAIYRAGGKAVFLRTLNTTLLVLYGTLYFTLSFTGVVAGKMRRIRREKKSIPPPVL